MALLIDDIELAWSSMRDSADASGWRSISIATIGVSYWLAGRGEVSELMHEAEELPPEDA